MIHKPKAIDRKDLDKKDLRPQLFKEVFVIKEILQRSWIQTIMKLVWFLKMIYTRSLGYFRR